MGSKSKSSSSTSSQINDSRIGATDQAIVNREIVDGDLDKSIVVTTTNTTTDNGAFKAAKSIANNSADEAFRFGRNISSDAFGFGKDALRFGEDALRSNEKVSSGAFKLVQETSADAYGFGEDAIDVVGDVVDDTLATILDTVRSSNSNVEVANKSILDSTNNALAHVERATRSDSAVSLEVIVKYLAGAVVIYSIAQAFIRGGR